MIERGCGHPFIHWPIVRQAIVTWADDAILGDTTDAEMLVTKVKVSGDLDQSFDIRNDTKPFPREN